MLNSRPPTHPAPEAAPEPTYTLAGAFVVHASRVHNVQPGRLHHKAQILDALVAGPET